MAWTSMKKALLVGVALGLTGCATQAELDAFSDPTRGFALVHDKTHSSVNKNSVWVQSHAKAEATAKQVHQLIHKKTIDAETAVQVALLSNKGLQAAYAEIGMSTADVWQEALPSNPKLTAEFSQVGVARTIESLITTNIARAMTHDRRIDLAEAKVRKAQYQAIEETLKLAHETRVAWINSVSAWERAGHIKQAISAADAGSDLAMQLGKTGAIPKAAQAREHVNYAELTAQLASARLEAREAKQVLIRKMGVWGKETEFSVPNKLPPLPSEVTRKKSIAAEALRNRIDLMIAKADLDIVARSYGLTQATRYVSDLDFTGGVEIEREDGKDVVSGRIDFDLVIPIFDSGQARLRKAEMAYMRSANLLAQRAAEIRSEAHSAYEAYRGRHEIALHHYQAVAPLRKVLEQQALLNNNGMISSTFELLQDVRAKVNSDLQADMAKRDFWLAEANLRTVIYGGGNAGGGGGNMTVLADAGGGPEH
ncbi:MAG: TolC family protein [Anderseniella sp.]